MQTLIHNEFNSSTADKVTGDKLEEQIRASWR